MTKSALAWLLEESQPSVRWRALLDLTARGPRDPEVRDARARIPKAGWAADILRRQRPTGAWVSEESLYRPKYESTNWMLLILADLGMDRGDARIRAACEFWIRRFAKKDGGFGADRMRISEMCITGNTARALMQFGYEDHPRVRSALRWLLRDQKANGGWRCGWRRGILDGWEAMSAFAAYPRRKWTAGIGRAVDRGAEFYLERELHREGPRYEPWYRFHYPVHYFYDVLVGLDLLTSLGFGGDKRLAFAANLVKSKRRPDGRWNLDAVHPDMSRTAPPYPSRGRFALEKPGRPSKMITLRAERALGRTEG